MPRNLPLLTFLVLGCLFPPSSRASGESKPAKDAPDMVNPQVQAASEAFRSGTDAAALDKASSELVRGLAEILFKKVP